MHAGEELVVYVGRDDAELGANTNLNLIATQYHAESGSWSRVVVQNLKNGKNEVTIPQISSLSTEHGGSLYVEFTGNNDTLNMSVRVSGGQEIPKLDISNAADETEAREAVRHMWRNLMHMFHRFLNFTKNCMKAIKKAVVITAMTSRTVFWEQRTLCWIR